MQTHLIFNHGGPTSGVERVLSHFGRWWRWRHRQWCQRDNSAIIGHDGALYGCG